MKSLSVLVSLTLVVGLTACGDSGSTVDTEDSSRVEALQLEKEKAEVEAEKAKAEAQREAQEARQAAKSAAKAQAAAVSTERQPEPEPEPEPEAVPDVVGLRLPEARATLSAAGYRTLAENTDTTFGIVVPSHFTVCEQSEPHGDLVTVLAQKYGC